MKTSQIKTSKNYWELAKGKELVTVTCILADSKASTGVGKFIMDKREGFRCALNEAVGMMRLDASWLEVGHPTWFTRDIYLAFLAGPKLEAENLGKLLVINQVLAFLVRL